MKNLRWLAIPALVLGTVACGSSSSSSSATKDTAADTAAGDTAAGDTSGASSSSDWCTLSKQLDADTSNPFSSNEPAQVQKDFEGIQAKIAAAVAVAPAEIKSSVETVQKAFSDMYAELKKVGFDVTKIDQTQVAAIGTGMDASTTAIDTYNEKECGIAPASADTSDTGSASSDTGTGTGLTGTVRDQVEQSLESIGLTADEAGCVVDNVDSSLAAKVGSDPSLLMSVFSTCNIDITRLAQIGSATTTG